MIQTVDQYVFLYRTLIEGILTMKTSISLEEFLLTRQIHMNLQEQFQVSDAFIEEIYFLFNSY